LPDTISASDALRLVVHAHRRIEQTPADDVRKGFGALRKILEERIRVHALAHVAAHVPAVLVQA
jgi:hypothetical protein